MVIVAVVEATVIAYTGIIIKKYIIVAVVMAIEAIAIASVIAIVVVLLKIGRLYMGHPWPV